MVLNWIIKRSAMNFTFDHETWFKVTMHSLPKRLVYVEYEPNRTKWWGVHMLWKKEFLSGLIWLWPLTSKHHSRSLTPFNQIPPVDKVCTRLDKGERDMCPDKDFWINSAIWPSHLTLKLKSRPLNILWPQHFVGEVWVWLDKGERKYALDKDFSFYYAIIKILDLDTWFKLTAHPLPRGTLRKKYEPDWAKGREDMLHTRDLRLTDGHTDHYIYVSRIAVLNIIFQFG